MVRPEYIRRYYRNQQPVKTFKATLPEIVVTPTDAQNWLLQKGRYKNNVAPFGDDETRQLAVNYLSQFDNEDAYDYNNRIDRLSDVLQGQLFLKNNVKEGKLKGRAHYRDGKAYVNSMEDIIAEASHPIQRGFGNNIWLDEARNKTYDADVDPRGGTRYAYPDTYEGETHAFFEPTLKEWIETGKIGKSSPIINKKKSTQKIVPKNLKEVTDSAASWDKQAIDSRILAMPSQLPPGLSFIYKNIGFPLLNKSRALGENLFNGTSQSTQQESSQYNNYQKSKATNARKQKHQWGGTIVPDLSVIINQNPAIQSNFRLLQQNRDYIERQKQFNLYQGLLKQQRESQIMNSILGSAQGIFQIIASNALNKDGTIATPSFV